MLSTTFEPDYRLVASELERRWEFALQAVAEVRDAAEQFARQSPLPHVAPEIQAQLRALGRTLPTLWKEGHLTPEQKKELLRSLIRHVTVRRPFADTLEATLVWISGAVSPMQLHPPISRQSDVQHYDQCVERILALGAEGHADREMARMLTAEGFRSARSPRVTAALVGAIRRARGQISRTEQFWTQAKLEGQWTVFGFSQA